MSPVVDYTSQQPVPKNLEEGFVDKIPLSAAGILVL